MLLKNISCENSLVSHIITITIMLLEFFNASVNLKKISRQGWIEKISLKNPESVADHTYSMAIISMALSDLQGYDSEKILKMVLLHDLAESKIGDLLPEQIHKEEKKKLENNAFDAIVMNLPNTIKSQYLKIWKEYQDNTSQESIFVHQIDKLEMALQAKKYQQQGHSKEKLKVFFESAKKEISDPKLKELFTEIIMEK